MKPDILGASLAGAGGGGYLYMLLRNPLETSPGDKLSNLLLDGKFVDMHFDDVTIDRDGLMVSVDGNVVIHGDDFSYEKLTMEYLSKLKKHCQ